MVPGLFGLELLPEAVAVHKRGCLETGVHAELGKDVLDVGPGGLRADVEFLGHDVVVGAVGQEGQDLALSLGER